ncbi:MAG: conserved membrane protein of unknown function [Nitrospira sp.]|nr:MAG: conserved membrane protein of unknown function [Nitrospira sp.]
MLKSAWQDILKQIVNRGWGLSWTIFGQLAYFLGVAVGVKLLTSYLGPRAFGVMALGLTVAGIGNLVFYGPFAQAALRFYTVCEKDGWLDRYFSTIVRYLRVSTVSVVALAAGLSAGVFLLMGEEGAGILFFSLIFLAASGVSVVQVAIHNASGNHRTVAVIQGTEAWARVVFAMTGILLVGPTATVALAGYATASVCVAVFLWRRLRQSVREVGKVLEAHGAANQVITRQMVGYAVPFMAFSVFGVITSFGDRWMIKLCCGLVEVGVYAALYQVAYAPLVILSNAITQVFLPLVYRHAGDGSEAVNLRRARNAHWKVLAAAGFCLLGWVVVTYVLGEPLLRLITTPEFAQSYGLLWVVASGGAIFYFGQFLIFEGLYKLQPQRYVFSKALHACVFFLTSWWLLSGGQGVYGVAIASIGGGGAYVGAILYANASSQTRDVRLRFPIPSRFESGKQ